MRYYDVNGILFGFEYQFDDFFIDNIEKYEIDKCDVQYNIESLLVDEIKLPDSIADVEINSRKVYYLKDKEITLVYKNGVPVLSIEKKNDYSIIQLKLLKSIDGLAEIEYVYSGIIFMELCIYNQMQSIHGSAISHKGKTIIFSGPSGVGKSTHVAYWKQFDPSIKIINDDKPVLSTKDEKMYVSGSPFSGKTKVNSNTTLPLHSIVFLEQGLSNEVKELSLQEKLIYVMRNINRPRQDELWNKTENLISNLVSNIPMYKASVQNHISAVKAVKDKIGV